jgi:hypothetical protein
MTTALAALLLISVCGFAADCNFTRQQLQDESLAILRQDYPAREFAAGESVDLIRADKIELGLDNLYAKMCAVAPLDAAARAAEIRHHFGAIMKLIQQHEAQQQLAWAAARKLVMLQLTTEEYFHARMKQGEFVTRPFVAGVLLTVVVDQPDGYQYVRKEDQERWSVSREALFDEALHNLAEVTMSGRLQAANGAEKLLASEEKDGYDAVRILVPWVREEAVKLLGEPFFAGIPNRDFLIMWSTANSAGFHKATRGEIQQDFAAQPYGLSARVLRVWGDGRIELE